MNNIDFVIPWVDGLNTEWLERFRKYAKPEGDSREMRFRDWDLLKYWLRSIEKFTPWVRKIHFITSGELPDWLNTNHPQLNWVRHHDYIPTEYLPTFNANTIEMNIHRIESLSEKFVYFNDDLFIMRPVCESHFFKGELPLDMAVMTAKPAGGGIIHMAINDLEVIDKHFDKHSAIKKNFAKWYSLKYGKGVISNILLYPWTEFSGFIDPHMPSAFIKSTLSEIWEKEPDILDRTCSNKFRTNNDVNQWLIRYWQLASGKFEPKNIKKNTLCIDITDESVGHIHDMISEQKYEIICLNDSADIRDFEYCKTNIQAAFEKIMPEKSAFEKQ